MRTGIAPARGPSSPTIGSLRTGTVTPTPHDFREALSSPALANVKSKSVTQEGPLGQREAQDSVSGHLSHPPPQAPRPGPRGWGRHLQPTEKTLLPGKATPEPPLDFRNHPPSPESKAGHALPRPPRKKRWGPLRAGSSPADAPGGVPGRIQVLTRSPGGPAGPSPPELPWEGRERARKVYYYYFCHHYF